MSLFTVPVGDINLTETLLNKNYEGFLTPNLTTDFIRANICITTDGVW